MYAVIETGGKQYRVELGTELEVERLDAEPGSSIKLERVLLVADGDETTIGRPLVSDASVSAEVLRQDRADKVIVFKYRPKARRRVKKGHRQEQTVLRISDISLNGKSAADAARKAERDRKTERERLEEAAARQAAEDAALAAKLAAQKAPPAKASPGPAVKTAEKPAGRAARSTASSKTKAAKADAKTSAAKPATRGRSTKAADAASADDRTKASDGGAKPARRRAKKEE
jgi:large subunit ribosomal protein L21